MAKTPDKPDTPKTPNPNAQTAKATMQIDDLTRQLAEANADKENVASDAQKMRTLLSDKNKEIASIKAENIRLGENAVANEVRTTELEEEVGALTLQLNSIEKPKPTRDRPERAMIAAELFKGFIIGHDRPQTIVSPDTARDAVNGARMLSAILDEEFGCAIEGE